MNLTLNSGGGDKFEDLLTQLQTLRDKDLYKKSTLNQYLNVNLVKIVVKFVSSDSIDMIRTIIDTVRREAQMNRGYYLNELYGSDRFKTLGRYCQNKRRNALNLTFLYCAACVIKVPTTRTKKINGIFTKCLRCRRETIRIKEENKDFINLCNLCYQSKSINPKYKKGASNMRYRTRYYPLKEIEELCYSYPDIMEKISRQLYKL